MPNEVTNKDRTEYIILASSGQCAKSILQNRKCFLRKDKHFSFSADGFVQSAQSFILHSSKLRLEKSRTYFDKRNAGYVQNRPCLFSLLSLFLA